MASLNTFLRGVLIFWTARFKVENVSVCMENSKFAPLLKSRNSKNVKIVRSIILSIPAMVYKQIIYNKNYNHIIKLSVCNQQQL